MGGIFSRNKDSLFHYYQDKTVNIAFIFEIFAFSQTPCHPYGGKNVYVLQGNSWESVYYYTGKYKEVVAWDPSLWNKSNFFS